MLTIVFLKKNEKKDEKKLFNFSHAPKLLVDEDSFIFKEN
jgi:hypothetical protein